MRPRRWLVTKSHQRVKDASAVLITFLTVLCVIRFTPMGGTMIDFVLFGPLCVLPACFLIGFADQSFIDHWRYWVLASITAVSTGLALMLIPSGFAGDIWRPVVLLIALCACWSLPIYLLCICASVSGIWLSRRAYVIEIPYGAACRSCGYSRYGLASDRCPECGMMFGVREPVALTERSVV